MVAFTSIRRDRDNLISDDYPKFLYYWISNTLNAAI